MLMSHMWKNCVLGIQIRRKENQVVLSRKSSKTLSRMGMRKGKGKDKMTKTIENKWNESYKEKL